MPEEYLHYNAVLIVMAGLIAYKLIDRAFDYFWKRGPGTEYVSVSLCAQNRAQCRANNDASMIKRAVLILVKYSDKVPEDEKDKIMQGMVE